MRTRIRLAQTTVVLLALLWVGGTAGAAPPDFPTFKRLLRESTDIIIGRVDSVRKTEEESFITQDGMSEFIYYHYEATVTVSRPIRGEWKEEERVTVRLRMEQDQRYMEVLLQEGEYGLLFLKGQGEDDPSRILTNKSNGVLPFFQRKIEFDSGKPEAETIRSLLADELKHAHETGNTDRITSLIGWSEFVQADLPLPLLRRIRESEDPGSITPALVYLVGKGDEQALHRAANLALKRGSLEMDIPLDHPHREYYNITGGLEMALENRVARIPDPILRRFLTSPSEKLNSIASEHFSRVRNNRVVNPTVHPYPLELDQEEPSTKDAIPQLESFADPRVADEEETLPVLTNTRLDRLETKDPVPGEYKAKHRAREIDPAPEDTPAHDDTATD